MSPIVIFDIVLKRILVFSLMLLSLGLLDAQTPTRHSYGKEARQWLLIYKPQMAKLAPIYLYAHANGNNPKQAQKFAEDLLDDGIAVVSWNSIPSLKNIQQVKSCWKDASLAFEWLLEHGEALELNVQQIFIGGTSRGSIVSWPLAHSEHPSIKGIHMQEALGLQAWALPDVWTPSLNVHKNSPELHLIYFRHPGVSDYPKIHPKFDTHDPKFGLLIQETYSSFDIGHKVNVTHTLNQKKVSYASIWSDIDTFILKVLK